MSVRGLVLEESPEGFFARFRAHAVEAHLSPEPWGSPILEVLAGEQVVYAFDRGPPPAPTGRAQVLLHGVVQEVAPLEEEPFVRREGDRYRLGGPATPLGEGFYLVEAPLKVVVYAEAPLPARATVLLWPPLMLFRE